MRDRLRGQVNLGRVVCAWLLGILSAGAEPQVANFPELDLLELGQRVEAAYPANPAEAIPYMQEIQGRLSNAMSEEFRTIYRENLYRLGLAHMLWYQASGESERLAAGIPYWEEFIQDFVSDERHPLAMLNRADSHYGVENWGAAVGAYLHVLQLYTQQLDGGELLGLLQRLVAAADEADHMAEIKSVLKRFLGPQFGLEVRLFSLNALFDQALVANDLSVLMELVGEIHKDRVFRYDLGLNLRLLNVGDRFEDDERYLEAGLLFSMVLPVEQILKAVEDSLIDLEERLFRRQFIASKESELLRERDDLRARRSEIADAPRYTANLRWRQARVLQLMGRSYEAYFGFLRLIREYPQHAHIEQFRYAAFLQALECDYPGEAITQGEAYLDTPAFVLFEKPIAAQLARLYEASGDVDQLALLADNFLHRFPYEPVAAQMAHSLGNAFFRKGATERILETFPFWAEEYPDGAFIDSVQYWSGMAYLFTGDFEPALSAFEELIETSPGSVYFKEAAFRRGVAFFGMGDYASARRIFTEWVETSPEHPLQPEAHVFLGDLDAMDAEVERALAHYREVEQLGGSQALVDHAYFESASLLLANNRYEEHTQLLQRYLDTYPNASSGAEAVLRLAEADLEQGKIASSFERYRDGIDRFGNRIASDHVDQLIDAWWTTDANIRARSGDTSVFIEKLLADADFRRRMLYDRVAQINYFQEHPAIPAELQEALTLRQPLFEKLADQTSRDEGGGGSGLDLEDFDRLLDWQARLRAERDQLPSQTPAAVFSAMREEALEAGQEALALRLLRVLNLYAGLAVSPTELGPAEVELASPATLVWIARIEGKDDALTARILLRDLIQERPESDAIADALHLLAHLEMEDGFFDAAADLYGRILDEYFSSPLAADAAIKLGEALRLARRYDAAVEAYSMVLNQREWRGELWAEATFKIGLCFLAMNEEGKAQGFFERTYLAYSGYPEWAGKAVLESADLLLARGERQSAGETYRFFLNSANAAESPLYPVINQKMEALSL